MAEPCSPLSQDWVSGNIGPFGSTRFLLEALDIRSNDKVLDLACGTGAVALELSDRLVNRGLFIGIDISRTSLLIAKNQYHLMGPILSNRCRKYRARRNI